MPQASASTGRLIASIASGVEPNSVVDLLGSKTVTLGIGARGAPMTRSPRGGWRLRGLAILCCQFLLLCASGAAHACGALHPGRPYAGVGWGNSTATVAKERAPFGTLDYSPDVGILRLLVGYQATRHFGVEGGYLPFGTSRIATSGGDFLEATVTGVEVTAVGSLLVARGIFVFARAGFIYWRSVQDVGYPTGRPDTIHGSDRDLAFSGGAQFWIRPRFGLRAE